MMNMIIVTEILSPRLYYVLDYLFNWRLGISCQLCDPKDYNSNEIEGPVLLYSNHNLNLSPRIIPEGLLLEDFFHHGKPEFSYFEDMPVLFADEKEGGLGFDIFSAVFWVLSRYEEYQPYSDDEHGRFPASSSLLFQKNLLETPIVDIWVLFLKQKLKSLFPELNFKKEIYQFQPTIDIDSPWCYCNKGLLRNLGGFFRDISNGKWTLVRERVKVLSGLVDDPFFTFNIIDNIHNEADIKPIYFVLIGPHGKFDKTISISKKVFRNLIISISQNFKVFLHPSYRAADDITQMEIEINNLEQLTGQKTTASRQHFLKIHLPGYYQMIVELGIQNDYSFGYADYPGFRAGTSRPFKFYDLSREQATNLFLHPLIIMDVTLQSYMGLNTDQATNVINRIVDQVKNVNGLLITLWHNQSFDETHDWKGWTGVYTEMLKKATK
jgi:hypothetical protein